MKLNWGDIALPTEVKQQMEQTFEQALTAQVTGKLRFAEMRKVPRGSRICLDCGGTLKPFTSIADELVLDCVSCSSSFVDTEKETPSLAESRDDI